MGREGGTEVSGEVDARAGFLRRQPRHVLGTEAPGPLVLDVALYPLDVGRLGGEREGPTLDEVAIDALGRRHPTDLVHRVEHLPLQGDRRLPPVVLGGRLPAPGEQRRAPAPIAARRSEAADLLLDDRYP